MTRKPLKREASEAARLLAQLGGRKGGQASAAALTPEQRQARARAAVASRWQGKTTLPVDQASVLARLKDQPVQLRIAPGAGGARRRAAIDALVAKGRISIVEVGMESITIVKGAQS